MALERDAVVRAALRLLDEVGLEGLSLRRLAKEFNVQAPALYWHFRDKQDLLDRMAAAATADLTGYQEPQPGQPWDEWLAERARATRHAMLAHRDGALLIAAGRPADDRWDAIERTLKALENAGFSAADAVRAVFTLTNYVLGTAIEEQQGLKSGADDRGVVAVWLDREAYPALSRAITAITDREAMFEYGLSLILDGMRAQLAAADTSRAD